MSSVRKHLVGSPEWWSHWKRIIGVEEPLECAVSVEVTKLGQLKTTEFSFYSKVYLKVVVKDARLSDALNCEGFDLQLNWDNALSTLKMKRYARIKDADNTFYYQVEGKFEDEMELEMFPFDTQFLLLNLSTDWDDRYVRLVSDHTSPSVVKLQENSGINSIWTVQDGVELLEGFVTSATDTRYSRITATVVARRVYMPTFLYISWMRQFVVVSLAFTSFGVSLNGEPSRDRLTVIVGLIFVASALFKKDEGVMTWLDYYAMTSFMMLAIILMYHGFGVAFAIDEEPDLYVFWGLLSLWLLLNVYYVGRAVVHVTLLKKRVKKWQRAQGKVLSGAMAKLDAFRPRAVPSSRLVPTPEK